MTDDLPNSLPAMVARLRARAGLTKAALGEKLGVKDATLHSWETTEEYRRAPSPRHMQALLDLADSDETTRAHAWALVAAHDAQKAGEQGAA